MDERLAWELPAVWTDSRAEATRTLSDHEGDVAPARDWAGHSDADLVAETIAGRRDAFDVLVERHQRHVYRTCYRVAGNHEDAADLAQEAFLKAYRGLSSFRRDASFSTWLYRIAVNAALNHVTGPGRRLEALEAARDVGDPRIDPADAAVERTERARALRAALARLPRKQRTTIVLRVYGELSHEEIARALGRSVGTVKANLFFALRNLRGLLRKTEA